MRVLVGLIVALAAAGVIWWLFDVEPSDVGNDDAGAEASRVEPAQANPMRGDGPTDGGDSVNAKSDSKPPAQDEADAAGAQPEPVAEQFKRAKLPPIKLTKTRVHRDGKSKRTYYQDARVLIEVNPKQGSLRTGEPPVPGATLVGEPSHRIWMVPESTTAEQAVTDLSEAGGDTEYSIALHGRPASGSAMQIPLSVLQLKFPPQWTPDVIQAWADGEELKSLTKLAIEPNWYSVQTTSGVDALETAQRLMAGGELLAAEPDWLRSRVPK